LKYAAALSELLQELKSLTDNIWHTQKLPNSFSHSRLVTLWKGTSKGSAKEPGSYRGLQVGSSLCKIIVMIILARLKEWYNLQLTDQQLGFREGRGTADGISTSL
jgi:hypothetical protein